MRTGIRKSLQSVNCPGFEFVHLLHRPGFWHTVRIPFSISGDFKKQYMSGLEIFELFRGFFKTVSPQPVAITEGHRFESLHPLHLKAPTLFGHKSPSGRCFILQSKRHRSFLYRTEIQFVQKILLICGKRNIFELRCPMPYYSEGLFLLKYSDSLLAGVLYWNIFIGRSLL